MATYLELCKEVHRLIRVGDAAPGSLPTAVTGQSDLSLDIVTWVKRAWVEIQQSRDEWGFMVKQVAPVLSAAASTITPSNVDANYAWLLPFSDSRRNPHVMIYATSEGIATEAYCFYIPYEQWRASQIYDRGSRPVAKPSFVTVMPDRTLQFDTTADVEYTLRADVRLQAQQLAADSDTPLNWPTTGAGLLAEFHDVIIWKAVMYYCATRSDAGILLALAQREYQRIFDTMVRMYVPDVSLDLGTY